MSNRVNSAVTPLFMLETKHCSGCGTDIPADAPLGQCPRCLIKLGFQAAPAFSLPVRDRFADYELVRQVGRGGMGVVYEAVQLRLHRSVALKMILDSQVASPEAIRRFKIEAEAAAKLDHPHIVPIYEVGEHENHRFLSMKLIHGKSLREMIIEGELGVMRKEEERSKSVVFGREKKVAQLVATMARAVYHAHQHGVLHRDIKPGNILIDEQGQPHLTDFGLAKLLDVPRGDTSGAAITDPGATLGTPSYMSPEQAAGRRVTAASDLYGLGAILYELLTGQPPFKAATSHATLQDVQNLEPKRPRSVCPLLDRDLETICLKCLEKNPNNRYRSAVALAEDLERWLRREPIQARPASIPSRLSRWAKRNPLGTALIGSIFAGLVAALILLKMAHDRQKLLDEHLAGIIDSFVREVEEMWDNPNLTHVRIDSQRLAALSRRHPGDRGPNALRLSFGLTIDEAPVARAQSYGAYFGLIEEKMSKVLHCPVLLDLKLYKLSLPRPEPVVSGDTDFMRINALAYVRAKAAAAGLQVVARERTDKEAVIFANAGLGLSNVHQLIGKRVAFAHTNSIISFCAKVRLARAGISGTDLGFFKSFDLDRIPPMLVDAPAGTTLTAPLSEGDLEMYAHRVVIEQVRAGMFDVGESLRRHFGKNQYKGMRKVLVELDSFPVPSDVYVARPGLDPVVVDAMRQSLLSLNEREKKVLELLHTTLINGFAPVNERDFDGLRAAETNEVAQFKMHPPPEADAH